jgi:hypothetical protein
MNFTQAHELNTNNFQIAFKDDKTEYGSIMSPMPYIENQQMSLDEINDSDAKILRKETRFKLHLKSSSLIVRNQSTIPSTNMEEVPHLNLTEDLEESEVKL